MKEKWNLERNAGGISDRLLGEIFEQKFRENFSKKNLGGIPERILKESLLNIPKKSHMKSLKESLEEPQKEIQHKGPAERGT